MFDPVPFEDASLGMKVRGRSSRDFYVKGSRDCMSRDQGIVCQGIKGLYVKGSRDCISRDISGCGVHVTLNSVKA
jgi:hypothetical protein